jgi:hypothetical protein
MSKVTTTTSAGHQASADTLAALLKSIGQRADAYCWHINGDDDLYKESSLAHLLGICQVEMDLIMEMSQCHDKENKKVDLKQLERLVHTVGKEHCELIKYRLKKMTGVGKCCLS